MTSLRYLLFIMFIMSYGTWRARSTENSRNSDDADAVTHQEGATAAGNGRLCICVLSYNRIDLLRKTLTAVTQHLREDEPHLEYGIAWVDNGSEDKDELQRILYEFGSDPQHPLKHQLNEVNQGLASGFNALFFDLCEGYEFVLSLEEDWVWNRRLGLDRSGLYPELTPEEEEDSYDRVPSARTNAALTLSMSLLRLEPDLLGVTLRGEVKLPKSAEWLERVLPVDRIADKRDDDMDMARPEDMACGAEAEASASCPAAEGSRQLNLRFRRRCMDVGATNHVWGAYSNGAFVYGRSHLVGLGRQYGSVRYRTAANSSDISLETFPDCL
eukprot:gene29388-36600_t